MPRTLRAVEGGGFYHVLNRGNGRQRIFHKPADYDAFQRVLAEALGRHPVELLAYCLMPNHWHLIVRPQGDRDLPAFMQWLMVTHVRRHHQAYGTRGGGHLYQGRYKSFPIEDDHHFLTVARYVEANAIRASLCARVCDWPWCSLHARGTTRATSATRPLKTHGKKCRAETQIVMCEWPVDRPSAREWEALIEEPLSRAQLQKLRVSVNRGRPFGEEGWVQRVAKRLGLTQSLNPPGRPRKRKAKNQ